MATHDYVIDNQSATSFRSDLNNVLQAIVTQNSNATAPASPFRDMLWYDTTTKILKKRNEGNSAWINLGTINEGAGTFTPSGERALSSQAQAEAGTDNATLMTPLRVAQAITVLAEPTFAANQATSGAAAYDFTGIPSFVREIEVHFQGASMSNADDPCVQLMVGGTPLTTGYIASSGTSGAEESATTGFLIYNDSTVRTFSGIMRIVRVATGVWVSAHSISLGSADANGGGYRTGVGTLDGIRVTRIGTGTYDAGNVTISYR